MGFLLIVGLTNAGIMYGCSAESDAPPVSPVTPGADGGKEKESSTIVADGTIGEEDVKDAGKDAKKDAKDAKVDTGEEDAAPDVIVYDPEGSPCTPANTVQERSCPMCGTQSRVCLDSDGGGPTWQVWGNCDSPPEAVCDPGATYPDISCGNCGTKQQICQVDCTWVPGLTCQNEGECSPGSTEWQQGLSCTSTDGGLTGRLKTCPAFADGGANNCKWSLAAQCTPPPPNPNFINLTGVGTFGKQFEFLVGKQIAKLNTSSVTFGGLGACPATLSTSNAVYQYVEVKNTTGVAMKVSLWTSTVADGGADEDTIMAYYAGGNYYLTPQQRAACTGYYNDGCDEQVAGDAGLVGACASYGAGLIKGEPITGDVDGYDGVSIGANSSITVYIASWYTGATGAGNIRLNAKVH